MIRRSSLHLLSRLAAPALCAALIAITAPQALANGKPQSLGRGAHAEIGASASDTSAVPSQLLADHVVVRKSERRMYLMHGSTVLRSYRVALGLNPVGPKEQEGDSRTPEGHYLLTRRNPRSEYFLSIQVSYPNDRDMQRARRNRLTPGGSIMIHGLPNDLRREPSYYEKRDWTDGCIAVSDSDMLEIWLMTPPDTPIDILP
ncbi:MAG TPA: L,D-transpeptidase family protein [Steroidobacteraceae bacterium]|nr:L,D-transpeptidase family protein [Steroidobacteraceae bacterium]